MQCLENRGVGQNHQHVVDEVLERGRADRYKLIQLWNRERVSFVSRKLFQSNVKRSPSEMRLRHPCHVAKVVRG